MVARNDRRIVTQRRGNDISTILMLRAVLKVLLHLSLSPFLHTFHHVPATVSLANTPRYKSSLHIMVLSNQPRMWWYGTIVAFTYPKRVSTSLYYHAGDSGLEW